MAKNSVPQYVSTEYTSKNAQYLQKKQIRDVGWIANQWCQVERERERERSLQPWQELAEVWLRAHILEPDGLPPTTR